MTAISWKIGQNDVWTDAAAWSPATVPGSGDDVTIAVAPVTPSTTYTVTLLGNGPAHSVTQTQAASTLGINGGTLAVGGTYALAAGQLGLFNGALQAAILACAGGTVVINSQGAITDTAIDGTLRLASVSPGLSYAQVSLDGDSLAGAGGSGPGSLVVGTLVTASLGDSPTLNGASVYLNGGTLAQGFGTLTLGSSVSVTATGRSQVGLSGGTLVSDAAISTAGSNTNLTVEGGTVTNGGTLAVANAGCAFIDAQTVSNAGLLSVGAGAYLQVAATGPGGFTNTGSIAVTGGGTLSLDTALTTAQLADFPVASGTLAISGTLDNTGATLIPGAGSSIANLLLQGGTITGGTIVNTGHFSFGQVPGGGEGSFDSGLVGVTIEGGLDVAANGTAVDIAGGLAVLPAAGSGAGAISVTGTETSLTFLDSETLDHAAITLGSATGTYESNALFAASPNGTATVLTLGPDVTVAVLGASATIEGQGQSFIANEGTIAATAAGGTLVLGNLDDSGLLALSGGGLAAFDDVVNAGRLTDTAGAIDEGGTLTNTGTVFLSGTAASYVDNTVSPTSGLLNSGVFSVSNGATANLGQYGAGWVNTGTLSISAAELSVAGTFTLAQLGHVAEGNGGTLALDGTLQNAGTLTLGAGGVLPTVALQSLGAISGGTISDPGSALLLKGGLLEATKYEGVLSLAQAGAAVDVGAGLVLTGASGSGLGSIALTGMGSVLTAFGSTLDGAVVTIGAAGAGTTLDAYYGETLTLGPQLTVRQVGALAQIGGLQAATVNRGTILAGQAGGTLSLTGFGFANAGTVAVSNGETLSLDTALTSTGTFTVTNGVVDAVGATIAGIDALHLTDSEVAVTGRLTATGGTLAAGAGGTISVLKLNGDLVGGTIHDGGGAVQFVGASTLDGVTYQGAMTVSRPFASVTVLDGLHVTNGARALPGTITLSGPGGALVWGSTQALDNAVLDIGSASNAYAAPAVLSDPEVASPAVQFGAHLIVRQTGTYATIGSAFGTFASASVIGANAAHGQLALGGDRFTNTGTIGISNADTVSATAGGFTNAGLIVVGTGSAFDLNLLDYFASGSLQDQSFANTGTVQMAGGMLAELTDNGAFPNVPLLNAAGGLVVGAGVVASQIDNAGTIEASTGVLNLVQKVTGTGALKVDAGAMLVTGGVSAGQTARFSGAGGVLGLMPPYFLGTIGGFASGDTIDLFNTAARSAAFSGSSIAVTLTSGAVLRLATTSALSGALGVTAGTHGDSLVRFAAGTPVPHTLAAAPAIDSEPAAPPLAGWAAVHQSADLAFLASGPHPGHAAL